MPHHLLAQKQDQRPSQNQNLRLWSPFHWDLYCIKESYTLTLKWRWLFDIVLSYCIILCILFVHLYYYGGQWNKYNQMFSICRHAETDRWQIKEKKWWLCYAVGEQLLSTCVPLGLVYTWHVTLHAGTEAVATKAVLFTCSGKYKTGFRITAY